MGIRSNKWCSSWQGSNAIHTLSMKLRVMQRVNRKYQQSGIVFSLAFWGVVTDGSAPTHAP
eukprot:3885131-Amphidinium_carterae.1